MRENGRYWGGVIQPLKVIGQVVGPYALVLGIIANIILDPESSIGCR
jgi:hypothetical protein